MYTRLDRRLLWKVTEAIFLFPLLLIAVTTAAQVKYGYIASWYVTVCTALIGTVLWIGGAHLKYKGDDFSKAAVLLFASSGVFIALIVHTILQDDTFFLNQEMRIVIIIFALAFAFIAYNMGRTATRYYAFKFFAFEEKRLHAIEALSIEMIVIALLLVTYFLFIS